MTTIDVSDQDMAILESLRVVLVPSEHRFVQRVPVSPLTMELDGL